MSETATEVTAKVRHAENVRKWNAANREKKAAASRKWNEANRERLAAPLGTPGLSVWLSINVPAT